jgi:hypothetical protein
LENREEAGGFWPIGLLLPCGQNRGEADRAGGRRGGARRRLRPRGRPGMRGKERGGRGKPIPVLTLSCSARWRRLHGETEARRRCLGAAALWSLERRGGGAVLLCWCGAASRGGRRPSFIGGGGEFGKGDIFSGEAAGELGELRELRPAMRRFDWVSVRRGWVGDWTRRAGVGRATVGR